MYDPKYEIIKSILKVVGCVIICMTIEQHIELSTTEKLLLPFGIMLFRW
jgi:hypothetical protein